jgi:hypothetical protein
MAAAPKRHCSYSIASAELAGCPNEGTHWLEGWGADLADGWYCQTHATEFDPASRRTVTQPRQDLELVQTSNREMLTRR